MRRLFQLGSGPDRQWCLVDTDELECLGEVTLASGGGTGGTRTLRLMRGRVDDARERVVCLWWELRPYDGDRLALVAGPDGDDDEDDFARPILQELAEDGDEDALALFGRAYGCLRLKRPTVSLEGGADGSH